jgi:predicted nucleic acid-binding protein
LVLDASTAILLAKIGLLRDVAGATEVSMGDTAFREATAKDVDDARLIRKLVDEQMVRVVSGRAAEGELVRDFRLGPGEAETIALARETGAIAGTDDGPAIRCLKVLGLPFTSAPALLVALVEIGAVAPELGLESLAKLERFGRYAPRILEDAARHIRAAGRGGRR